MNPFRATVVRWGLPNLEKAEETDIDWSALERWRGIYNLKPISDALRATGSRGKSLILCIWTHSNSADKDFASSALPGWLKCRRIRTQYEYGQIDYPDKRDPVYQGRLRSLIAKIAAQFAGEFAAIHIEETAIPFTPALRPLWAALNYSDESWLAAQNTIIDIWSASFPSTPMMVGFNRFTGANTDGLFMQRLADHCVARSVGFIDPGLRNSGNKEQSGFVYRIFAEKQTLVPIGFVLSGAGQGDILIDCVNKACSIAPQCRFLIFPARWHGDPNYPAAIALANSKFGL